MWWQKWPSAQMDHGTVCISCHTVVPYALVRPALRQQLGEKELTAPEATMLASIERRVNGWSQMTPFYTDAANGPRKTDESHAKHPYSPIPRSDSVVLHVSRAGTITPGAVSTHSSRVHHGFIRKLTICSGTSIFWRLRFPTAL